jgi:hypothetical protein
VIDSISRLYPLLARKEQLEDAYSRGLDSDVARERLAAEYAVVIASIEKEMEADVKQLLATGFEIRDVGEERFDFTSYQEYVYHVTTLASDKAFTDGGFLILRYKTYLSGYEPYRDKDRYEPLNDRACIEIAEDLHLDTQDWLEPELVNGNWVAEQRPPQYGERPYISTKFNT